MTRTTLGWLAAAVLLRVAANLVVRHLGFVAISDDDYARVVIAQHFAHAPTWDPSGTSWLPFPFWLTGTVMFGLGPHLDVAQALAWVTSLACVPLFWLASRFSGQNERWAGWSTCAFALFPQAVWIDLATVPEGYAAVLALLALAACNRRSPGERLLGVGCIIAASLSRYELWPTAALVAAVQLISPAHAIPGVHGQKWWLALGSVVGPIGWMLHGVANHGSALFFVTRVASYRALLGQGPKQWLDLASNYPSALVSAAPELTALCLAVIAVATFARLRGHTFGPIAPGLRYPALGALVTFAFLVWGDAKNGAPTHHPERALQVCWLVALVSVGVVFEAAVPSKLSKVAGLGALALLTFGLQRTNAQSFVDREREVALGKSFTRCLSDAERLLIETHGYGYTAVAAATGQPWNVVGLNAADPRQTATLWDSVDALSGFIARERVRWLIVPPERASLTTRVARVVGESDLGLTLETQ